jgi:hypothetical protein
LYKGASIFLFGGIFGLLVGLILGAIGGFLGGFIAAASSFSDDKKSGTVHYHGMSDMQAEAPEPDLQPQS